MLRQTTKSPQQRVAHVDLVRVGTEMDGVTPLRKPMFSELYRPQWWTNAPLIVQDPFFVTHVSEFMRALSHDLTHHDDRIMLIP